MTRFVGKGGDVLKEKSKDCSGWFTIGKEESLGKKGSRQTSKQTDNYTDSHKSRGTAKYDLIYRLADKKKEK